jgi:hypothetical protein
MKFDEKPTKPAFINIHLFQKGKREASIQREKCPKNAENFASEREEGKREIEIQIWREAANTELCKG